MSETSFQLKTIITDGSSYDLYPKDSFIRPDPLEVYDYWIYYLKRKNRLFLRHIGGRKKLIVSLDLNTEEGKQQFDFINKKGYGFKFRCIFK